MTAYGPYPSPQLISQKAKARKQLLERIRRQRAHNAQALRQKLLSTLRAQEDY